MNLRFGTLLVSTLVFGTCLSTVIGAQTTLFADNFNTSGNSNDINFEYNSGRQSGILSPLTYTEFPDTATGGIYDAETQVDNPSLPGTLMMTATGASQKITPVYASPNYDFALSQDRQQHYHIDMTPGTFSSGDDPVDPHWVGFSFGATQKTLYFLNDSTGILIRPGGVFAVFDNDTDLLNGNLGTKAPTQFYGVDYYVNSTCH